MNTAVYNEQNEYQMQATIKQVAPPGIEHYIND